MKKKMSWMRRLFEVIAGFGSYVVKFAKEAPRSLKGHLNLDELTRVAVASFIAGGGAFGFLDSVVRNIGVIFPAPADAALAVMLITLILDVARRLQHGDVVWAATPRGDRAR